MSNTWSVMFIGLSLFEFATRLDSNQLAQHKTITFLRKGFNGTSHALHKNLVAQCTYAVMVLKGNATTSAVQEIRGKMLPFPQFLTERREICT